MRASPAVRRERVGDQVDGLRGLAHQDLGGGVGDDGLAEVGAEQVGGVLGDDRERRRGVCGRPWPAGTGTWRLRRRGAGSRLRRPRRGGGRRVRRPARWRWASTSRQIASRARSMPGARSSSASCRVDHTTRCPRGRNGGGAVEQVPERAGRPRATAGRRGCRRPGAAAASRVAARSRSSGAGPGQVAGSLVMPGRGVGGDDRLVQGGPFGRRRLLPEQHRDEGVQEQRPPGEGVGAAVAGRDVERVEPDAGGAELDGGAADRVGQAQVLVFGVDDRHLDPVVQGPQDLELDEVGLAGAGAGEDDAVVVVLGPPVPPHDAGGGGVEPVEVRGCNT